MQNVTRVIGYARVSTEKQADSGLSLEHQKALIEKECARRGWILSDLVVEEGVSGKSLKRREGLQNALQALMRKDAEVLMSPKLDRLSRSVADVCNIGEMAKTYGWDLVLLDVAIDTSTPYGRAQLNMMATFAQLERELIGQRTREALAVLKHHGKRLGRPVVMGADAETLILKLRAEKLSMQKIAEVLNAENVPTAKGGKWHASTVRVVLERRAA